MDTSDAGKHEVSTNFDQSADQNTLVPHLRWELNQVMIRVKPEDLSANEIAALLVVLRPAHSRLTGRPSWRPRLRLVGRDGQQSAP